MPHCPEGLRPTDLTGRFDAQAGKFQLEAEVEALLWAQRRNGVHGHTQVIEVTNNSTVGVVHGHVGECAQLMPVVSACLPRGKRDCLHTLPREWLRDKAYFVKILVSDRRWLAVTEVVREGPRRPLLLKAMAERTVQDHCN